ncbi:serum response factor-binding protein 1 [Pangasianodon hypophthalmus]|uniref:serum response factor-binding protein 1 n=1 Tax=Pangasianodon hypophthalmus TaxID=310915 RepID=UPI002307E394|nr:serum response factor-binding protein 1 [Pangasianodon hypophthalmus]
MPAALNLSNEVVKMRAEVKRVKVLIIRKLTRQIMALKKKKGTEADLERNQRRAARLLEEIHELKALAPDSVTKAALQSDISFEKVCQSKDSSLSERATARIATHPEFSKKIQSIKNAVEAFKAERISAERAEKKKDKKSRDVDQQERESKLDSDDEEGSEEDDDDGDDDDIDDDGDDDSDDDGGGGSSQKVQKADEDKLKEPTKQNKDSVTAKESSSETGSTPAEVVRMRKEVKKLRVLIIRNLTQQITSLKKAKADESELKGNMEGVARLQKEVQVLRTLLPDLVTTRALEGSIDMEKVFQDPESSVIERATARISTHPRFVKKLQDVRQAIEEEKTKAEKAGEKNKDVSEVMKAEDSDDEVEEEEVASDDSDDDDDDDDDEEEEEEEEEKEEEKVKETHPTLKVIPRSNVGKPPEDTKLASTKEKSKGVELEKAARSPANPKSSSKPAVKAVQSLPSKSKEAAPPLKQVSKPDTKQPGTRKDKEESDLSDSDEEKEYFDDSTEERFHKQSSYSEQSDDDDFFLGKVSKLKKKKSDTAPRKEKTNDPNKAREKEASETPQFKMQSVFCSTLSKSSSSSQKGKHSGPNPPRFQNQKRSQGDEKPSWVKSQGSGREKRPPGFKNQMPGSRESSKQKGPGGDKTGKPAFERKNTPVNKAARHSQQALHPSWEASRKRKEQQAQITAFQGKKIKFDDDD